MQRLFQAAVIATILGGNAWAQDNAPIERIRMTDNELSCGQIYGESQKMDKVIAEASNSQSTNQSAGVVANVAGQAATSGGTRRLCQPGTVWRPVRAGHGVGCATGGSQQRPGLGRTHPAGECPQAAPHEHVSCKKLQAQ